VTSAGIGETRKLAELVGSARLRRASVATIALAQALAERFRPPAAHA
jgi:hypothetical protein